MQFPWVGSQFKNPNNKFGGRKILIVGESHYSDNESIGQAIPDITEATIKSYIKGASIPFFTKIVTFLTGVPASENNWSDIRNTWEHLAFYNYIPVVAAAGPREFDRRLWALGEVEYLTVLSEVAPDLIVVLGFRLWDNAYHRHTDGNISPGDRENNVFDTVAGEKRIRTIKLVHPSSTRFSGVRLNKIYGSIINA